MRGSKLTQWRMQYALWRLRKILRVMLGERHKLHSVRATENQQKIFALLAEYCDRILRDVQGMLEEVTQTLADPLAAMRRKGLRPEGNRLVIDIELTFPQLDVDAILRRVRIEFPQEVACQQSPVRANRRPLGILEIMLLVWVFSEIFEDNDKD